MVEKLLKVRSLVKKRKPTYKRVQSNQYAKFRDVKWRRPKGKGNKDRRNRQGHVGMLKVGYGSPSAVKGLNKAGLKEVIVMNVLDLKDVNTKTDVAVIGRTVGKRKKLEILKEAKKLGLNVGNVKDMNKEIEKLTKKPKEKKKEKTKRSSKDASKESKEKKEKVSEDKVVNEKKEVKTKAQEKGGKKEK